MTEFYTVFQTPLGLVYVECKGGVVSRIRCIREQEELLYAKGERKDSYPLLMQARKELESYFFAQSREFEFPYYAAGSGFDRDVWEALLDIPYGYSASYGDIAKAIGRPKAARAVGGACGRNPLWIMVPCHRVIGSDTRLRGYAGGVDKKQWLLRHEQCRMQ